MLRRQDVGHRIVIRRIVGSDGARTLYSDLLGELIELAETHLTLTTGNGMVRVPLAEVHRAKRVPPAGRPNAAGVTALELAAAEAWPAPVEERLGDWRLRATGGWSIRGNSALPVGDPDRPLEAAIDAVERWYAERGLPPTVSVPLPLAAPVGAALDARGWTPLPLVLVQTAALGTVRATPGRAGAPAAPEPGGTPTAPERAGTAAAPDRAALPPVTLPTVPSDDWLAVAGARKGGLPTAALRLLTGVEPAVFAECRESSGELLGIARGTVTGSGRWLGLTLVEVLPAARRRGVAGHLIRTLVEWAAAQRAERAFVQVVEDNDAAVALYRGLGFRTHHTYLSRTLRPAGR